MAGCADDRTCRVTSGAAGIQPGDGCGIGHALVKAEGVVNMVVVIIADAKKLLDLPERQGEDVYHPEQQLAMVSGRQEVVQRAADQGEVHL
jgi:hypothetical protein